MRPAFCVQSKRRHFEAGPRKVGPALYMEPRWTSDGTLVDGPLVRVTELRKLHRAEPAVNGFNCPWCWSCGDDITDLVHMMETEYLYPVPTYDIVHDYVHGGARYGAIAHFCSNCCPRCKR